MSRSSFPRPTQPSPSDPALRRSARFHGNAFAAAARATCFLDAQRGSRGVERGARERERERVYVGGLGSSTTAQRSLSLSVKRRILQQTVSVQQVSVEIGQGKFYGYDLFSQIAAAPSASSHSSIKSASVLDLSTLSTGPFFFSVSVRVSNCLNPKVSCFCCCCLFVFCFVCGRRGDAEMRKWNRWRFSLRGVFPQY